ncbi:MAG: hypothetical protein LBH22_06120 [Bacteroidales bacterium]|jgi:hypothetical protein|nr:hypothetical protein [Bacteroidales bacterium]
MSEQPNSQQKEIDLLNVTGKMFSGIGKGIQNLFTWLKRTIQGFFRLALKYWWILLILTILGGAFGYFKTKLTKPYFETEMLVEASVVNRIQIADRINSLQKMIRDGNNTFLAKQLSLPIKEVEHIFFIKADFINIKAEGRATRMVIRRDKDGVETEHIVEEITPQFIRIKIRTRENESINRLAQAIVYFVENDSYIAEQTTLAKRVNFLQQEAIEFEIQQLMLFQKKNIGKSPQVMTAGNTPFMVQNEERTYTNEILELKGRLASLQREHELLRSIFVIQPFTPFENPVDKRLKNILMFACLFFAVGYGVLLFREGLKRV